MEMRMKFIGLTALVLLVGACTNAAPRSINFSSSSKDGLVVFKLGTEVPKPVSLTLARFDRASNRVTANSFSGQYFVEHIGSTPRHYVVQVPAGSYVIKNVSVQDYNLTTIVCLGAGTVSFDISPGQQLYLGDLVFDGSSIRTNGRDVASAQAAMRDYPGVQGQLVPAELSNVTFSNTSRLGIEICGG